MTNTPKPQANTLDEILRPWLEEAQSEYGTGHNDHKKRAFIEIETAKQQIQALITEARIDQVEKYDNHCAREMAMLQGEEKANGSLAVLKEQGYGSPYAKDRLKTLKENK